MGNLVMPLKTEGKLNAAHSIISILGKTFPLNAKAIYQKIKADEGGSVSYQGVHKSVQQLLQQNVIAKNELGYSLSLDWIKNVKRFGDQVFERYAGHDLPDVLDMKPGESISVEFNENWVTPYYWMLNTAERLVLHYKSDIVGLAHMRHTWPATVVSNIQYLQLKLLSRFGKVWFLSRSGKPLDEALMGFWRNVGFKCKTGVECASNSELIVQFDYVFQVHHPQKMIDLWDKTYASMDESGKDLSATHRLAYDVPVKTDIVITRNKEIADQYRRYTWKYFK